MNRPRTLALAAAAVVLLREVFGYSFREIGVIAGVPTFTAASRYRLGLARLRLLLEGSR